LKFGLNRRGIILVEERHYQDHLEKAADLIREDQGKGVFRRVAEAMFNRDAKLAEDMVTMCRQLAVSKQELEKELASANMRLAAVTEKTNLIMESANSIHAQAVEELARARKEAEKILQAARKTEASVLQRSEGIQQESDDIIDSARVEARRTQKQLVSEARKEADAILAAARKEALKLQVNAMKGTKLQELKRRESELEKRIALNESSLQELGEEEPHLKMNVLNSLVYARVNVDCGTLLNSVAAGTFRISEANNHVLHSLAILTKDLTRLELQEKTCKTYLDNLYALTSQSEDCGSLIRRYVNILEKEGILGLKDCIPNFAARMGRNE
jgi:vacuolar-type H+-ATPase subunit H